MSDAAIDAAAVAVEACIRRYVVSAGQVGWGAAPTELAAAAVEAARPVIAAAVRVEALTEAADAIKDMWQKHFAEYGNEETGPRSYDWALTRAERLVRGLAAKEPKE